MMRQLTCIICPRGCALIAEINSDIIEVSGNICPKGKQYAIDECTNPVRTVTSTMRVSNRNDVMVSVKTAAPVPKEKIFEVMEKIRKTQIAAPVKEGDIILFGACGVNIVATKNIL